MLGKAIGILTQQWSFSNGPSFFQVAKVIGLSFEQFLMKKLAGLHYTLVSDDAQVRASAQFNSN